MAIASPPDDDDDGSRRRAKVFFDRGRILGETGNYDYAIEMYIQGLRVDPDNVAAHQALREISLKRASNGGRDMGMIDRMKMPKSEDQKQAMLNAEKLLAYMPNDIERVRELFEAAKLAGMRETAEWIGEILRRGMDR